MNLKEYREKKMEDRDFAEVYEKIRESDIAARRSRTSAGKTIKRFAREIKKHSSKNELNSYWSCEFSHGCAHLHIIPKTLKEDMRIMGHTDMLKILDITLDDALRKTTWKMKHHPLCRGIYAVSPTLRAKHAQEMFRSKGFTVSKTDQKIFRDMFKSDNVWQAWIGRDEAMESFRKID